MRMVRNCNTNANTSHLYVLALHAPDNGFFYLGGSFANIGGAARTSLARKIAHYERNFGVTTPDLYEFGFDNCLRGH